MYLMMIEMEVMMICKYSMPVYNMKLNDLNFNITKQFKENRF